MLFDWIVAGVARGFAPFSVLWQRDARLTCSTRTSRLCNAENGRLKVPQTWSGCGGHPNVVDWLDWLTGIMTDNVSAFSWEELMFVASLILPGIALGLIAYLFYLPLPTLFGKVEFLQTSDPVPDQLQAIATEREQDDEYETLMVLGFKPLGTLLDVYGMMQPKHPTLVFAHSQFPIFAHLSMGSDEQLYIKMSSAGQGECILETSSYCHSIEACEPTYRASRHSVFNTEDIFSAHLKALSQWELEGFKAVPATSLKDVEQQNQVVMEKAAVKKLIRNACLVIAFGSLAVTVFFPILFGTCTAVAIYMSLVSLGVLKFGTLIPTLVSNVIAVWSIGCSAFWYKTVLKPMPKPIRNSLANRPAVLTTKRVEIKKVVDKDVTRFELPYRNDPDQRASAFQFVFVSIIAVPAFSIIPIFIGRFLVMQFGILCAIPVLLWSIINFRIIAKTAGKGWRPFLGKSIHELSIKDGQLHSRERGFIVHVDQQCPVDEIVAIHVTSIDKYRNFSPYHSLQMKPDWGILVIERTPAAGDLAPIGLREFLQIKLAAFWGRLDRRGSYPLQIAACYPLDFLTSLAHELAGEIGLNPDKVIISEDILNPKFDSEQAETSSESNANLVTF